MAAMIWDEQAQAFKEAETPMKHDPTAGAWTDTTGLAWDNEAQAWTERWGTKVSAYVYGAVSETITIRKNGIIVATVQTDSSGKSTEQITLSSGTYTLTGSVSGWTEEQTVDSSTTKFRAMPEGALYWHGYIDQLCGELVASNQVYLSNWTSVYPTITLFTNYVDCIISGDGNRIGLVMIKNKIDMSNYTKIKVNCPLMSNLSLLMMVVEDLPTIWGGGITHDYAQSGKETTYEFSANNECYITLGLSENNKHAIFNSIVLE